MARRIISKAILFAIKGDIQDTAGSHQLCGGQIVGIEVVVHSTRSTEALLLINASNTFNNLNRANGLINIQTLYPPPPLSTALIYIYQKSTDLSFGVNTLLS